MSDERYCVAIVRIEGDATSLLATLHCDLTSSPPLRLVSCVLAVCRLFTQDLHLEACVQVDCRQCREKRILLSEPLELPPVATVIKGVGPQSEAIQ